MLLEDLFLLHLSCDSLLKADSLLFSCFCNERQQPLSACDCQSALAPFLTHRRNMKIGTQRNKRWQILSIWRACPTIQISAPAVSAGNTHKGPLTTSLCWTFLGSLSAELPKSFPRMAKCLYPQTHWQELVLSPHLPTQFSETDHLVIAVGTLLVTASPSGRNCLVHHLVKQKRGPWWAGDICHWGDPGGALFCQVPPFTGSTLHFSKTCTSIIATSCLVVGLKVLLKHNRKCS